MKIKETLKKVGTKILMVEVSLMSLGTKVFATSGVTITGDGGEIAKSVLGTGTMNFANDMAAFLRRAVLIISIPFILWFLVKMVHSDEQDQARYKKRLITVLVIDALSSLVTVIINLISSYFV